MTLTLAYENSCTFCANTATAIEKVAGDRLRITPLNSEDALEAFRKNGTTNANRPTLIERDSTGELRVLQGAMIPVTLLRHLGFRKSIQVLSSIGQTRNSGPNNSGSSRRAFVGTAIGAGTVATALWASPATAQPSRRLTSIGEADTLSTAQLTQSESDAVFERFYATAAGLKARRLANTVSSSNTIARAKISTSDTGTHGVSLELIDGSTINRVNDINNGRFIAYHEMIKDNTVVDSWATVMVPVDINAKGEPESMQIIFESNGDSYTDTEVEMVKDSGTLRTLAAAKCSSTACRRKGRCWHCQCTKVSVSCASGCCSACGWACGTVARCIGCLLLSCAACASHSRCCTSSSCKYRATGNTGC